MVSHRGFSAWIESDGVPFPEYRVIVDERKNRVSCFIPCETGKTFSVSWMDHGSAIYTAGYIYLDGRVISGRYLAGCGITKRDGIQTGYDTERPFVFAEAPSAPTGSKDGVSAGTIVLKIMLHPMTGIKEADRLPSPPQPSTSKRNRHHIDYGKERKTTPEYPYTWAAPHADRSKDCSYVTFIFRYRSKEFLTFNGIMTNEVAPPIPPEVLKAFLDAYGLLSSSSTGMAPEAIQSLPAGNNPGPMTPAPNPPIASFNVPTHSRSTSQIPSEMTCGGYFQYPGEGLLYFGPIAGLGMTGVQQPEQGADTTHTLGGQFGSPMSMTLGSSTKHDLTEQMDSVPNIQAAPAQFVRNIQTAEQPNGDFRYPGEGILDFGPTMDPSMMGFQLNHHFRPQQTGNSQEQALNGVQGCTSWL